MTKYPPVFGDPLNSTYWTNFLFNEFFTTSRVILEYWRCNFSDICFAFKPGLSWIILNILKSTSFKALLTIIFSESFTGSFTGSRWFKLGSLMIKKLSLTEKSTFFVDFSYASNILGIPVPKFQYNVVYSKY